MDKEFHPNHRFVQDDGSDIVVFVGSLTARRDDASASPMWRISRQDAYQLRLELASILDAWSAPICDLIDEDKYDEARDVLEAVREEHEGEGEFVRLDVMLRFLDPVPEKSSSERERLSDLEEELKRAEDAMSLYDVGAKLVEHARSLDSIVLNELVDGHQAGREAARCSPLGAIPDPPVEKQNDLAWVSAFCIGSCDESASMEYSAALRHFAPNAVELESDPAPSVTNATGDAAVLSVKYFQLLAYCSARDWQEAMSLEEVVTREDMIEFKQTVAGKMRDMGVAGYKLHEYIKGLVGIGLSEEEETVVSDLLDSTGKVFEPGRSARAGKEGALQSSIRRNRPLLR